MFAKLKQWASAKWEAVKAKAQDVYQSVVCRVQGIKRVAGEFLPRVGFGVGGLALVGSAHAAGPDLTSLTSAVDFSTVTAAVLGVAASLIVVYIAWKGAKMVIAAVRGG